MSDAEKSHWTTELGWLAIFVAVAVSIVVFVLPVFEGGRAVAVGAVILPLVVIGAFLILLKRNPGQTEDSRGERRPVDVNAGAVMTAKVATGERDAAVTDDGKTARGKGMSAKNKKRKENAKKGPPSL